MEIDMVGFYNNSDKNIVAIHVMFDSSSGKIYEYRALSTDFIIEGDRVIIENDNHYTIASVVRVSAPTSRTRKWIVAKLDTGLYNARCEHEQQFVKLTSTAINEALRVEVMQKLTAVAGTDFLSGLPKLG